MSVAVYEGVEVLKTKLSCCDEEPMKSKAVKGCERGGNLAAPAAHAAYSANGTAPCGPAKTVEYCHAQCLSRSCLD